MHYKRLTEEKERDVTDHIASLQQRSGRVSRVHYSTALSCGYYSSTWPTLLRSIVCNIRYTA